jgi:hypothetical protein
MSNTDIKIELKKIKKKCEIMHVVCSKHCGYYKKLNNFTTSILIIMSSFATILNSIWETAGIGGNELQLITILLNAAITIIISFQRVFRYEAKANNYSKSAVGFNKMSHTINQKIISQQYDISYLESCIIVYDNAVENITDGFKEFIIHMMKKEYDDIDADFLPGIFGKVKHKLSVAESDSSAPPIIKKAKLRNLSEQELDDTINGKRIDIQTLATVST